MILSSNPSIAQYSSGTSITSVKGVVIWGSDGSVLRHIAIDSDGHTQVDVLTMPTTTVQATNLDIRDLSSASDSVTVTGGVTISGTVAVTQSGTWDEVGINDSGNSITVDNAALSVVGGGAEATALRVTIASDSTGVLSVDDNGSSLTVDGTVAATQSGTWTVQPGNTQNTTPWLAAIHDGTTKATVRELGTNDALNVALVDGSGNQVTSFGGGTQYTEGDTDASITGTAMLMEGAGNALVAAQGTAADGLLVNLGSNNDVTVSGNVGIVPITSGGLSIKRDIDLDEASAENIKASAGQVYGWYLFNNASSPRYVKLYNKASAPTVGTDTPLVTIGIPANSAANVEYTTGITFDTGIGWAATTAVADSDTGAPGANEVIANLFYK